MVWGRSVAYWLLATAIFMGFVLPFWMNSGFGIPYVNDSISLLLISLIIVLLILYLVRTLPEKLGGSSETFFLASANIMLPPVVYFIRPVTTILGYEKITSLSHPDTNSNIDKSVAVDMQIQAVNTQDIKVTPISEKITEKALSLAGLTVYDILLPRNQVQVFNTENSVEENLDIARLTGHTRFPLCDGDLDHCIGIVHIKDIFRFRGDLESLDFELIMREIVRFDIEEPLDKVLQVFLHKRVHMALVNDEFGGVVGLVTLERILEELVGEIQDEFDREDKMISEIRPNYYKVLGLTPIHELEDQLKIEGLDNEEVSTIGGLVTYHLGRIPEPGEQLFISPLKITVLETDDTRLTTLYVEKIDSTEAEVSD